MIFGTNNAFRNFDDISLNYGNDIIERVYKFKYLGVIFDPTLAWNEHVDYKLFFLLFLNELVLFAESNSIFPQPL